MGETADHQEDTDKVNAIVGRADVQIDFGQALQDARRLAMEPDTKKRWGLLYDMLLAAKMMSGTPSADNAYGHLMAVCIEISGLVCNG